MSPSPSRPVFVHSGWRCSSTYIWTCFRKLDSVRAYYEPWHEQLARLDEAMIATETPAGSGLRHPGGAAPYLSEFRALLDPAGGVRGYDARFALDSYLLDADAEDSAQEAYVADLIGTARAAGETPVLACCRTLGRIGWLRRRFDGFHIVLIRDPVQQWLSFHSLRKRPRPTYFELCQYVILSELPGRRATAEDLLGRRLAGRGTLAERMANARRNLKRASDAVSFAAFMAVYILSYLRALPQADLVVDVDRLARDPAYARSVEAAVRATGGLSPDFSDCKAPAPHIWPPGFAARPIVRRVVDALNLREDLATPGVNLLHAKLSEALEGLPLDPPLDLHARLRAWSEGLVRQGRHLVLNRT